MIRGATLGTLLAALIAAGPAGAGRPVEGPFGEARSLAVNEEIRKAIPNKPIKFVINTHHHIDHAGGLRAAVAEGAAIVTSIMNKRIYPQYLTAPLTFAPC